MTASRIFSLPLSWPIGLISYEFLTEGNKNTARRMFRRAVFDERYFRSKRLQFPQGETTAASAGRRHDDALVLGPAHAPCEADVLYFARLGLEGPFQHATFVAQIGRGRRRSRGQHFNRNLLVLANRQLILDSNAKRKIMTVAHG